MSDAESVTISLLPVSLSLVHLPRSRLEHFTQHVLRQILQPTPVFLNVTCNEVEVSLFAEYDTLQEFHKAARKDARRVRQRDRESRTDAHSSPGRAKRTKEDWEPVEVTSERWKVLQIDSHSDCLDNSGARVHELSTPLAAAGISILYQSSYMSDFIFTNLPRLSSLHIGDACPQRVKEERLAEVMSLLGSAGFDLYLSDPSNLTAQISTFASPLISPSGEDEPPIGMIDLNTFQGTGRSDSGIVFTRSRSNTSGTTSSSSSRSQELLYRTASPPNDPRSPGTLEDTPRVEPTGAPPARPARSRTLSHSPSACDVRVLSPDITCVGLSDDSADTWSLKIIKLVAFPELILGSMNMSRHTSERRARSVRPQSPSMLPALPEEQFRVLSLSEGEVGSGSDTTTRVAPESPKKDLMAVDDMESPLPDDEHDGTPDDASNGDGLSDSEDSTRRRRPRLPHLDTLRTVHASSKSVTPSPRSRSTSSSSSESAPPPLVPFFSFTRTPEGSSLAAPVSLLATLFPASERHMVMCSQELDVLDSRNASPERWEEEEEDSADDDADGALPEPDGTLKCLQIDLRKFGLEKHGLVNRFSRTLEDNGINHMYSSTYKTANLLVDKAHASRAQALLRSC